MSAGLIYRAESWILQSERRCYKDEDCDLFCLLIFKNFVGAKCHQNKEGCICEYKGNEYLPTDMFYKWINDRIGGGNPDIKA